ncbi:MAG: hypothetical protein Q4D55_02030 [Eubacteriales bacterium]|nr:hypothetical protein [Eubacteriales bacterium]
MKRFLGRLAVLLVVFVLGVTGTALLLNSETTDDRSDMNDPTLPEVAVDMGGVHANRMYGYREKMEAAFIRDSLTPLDTTRQLKFAVNPYDTEVTSLSYEIRTSDGKKVIENRKIKNLGQEDRYLTASASITSDLRMNQEYSMQITLDTSVGEVYYYTRIISRSQLNADQYVRFVKSFYEKCMDKTAAEDLTKYLEPGEGGSTNFTEVDIHSTFAQISWGSLAPQIHKRGVPVIKDINETTASLTLDYQIGAKDEEGNEEIYDVTEFYRMRYTKERIMLLDFQRSAKQIFRSQTVKITSDGLLLGVRDRDVEYAANSEAQVVVFVQQGDLWSYSPEDGKLIRIFSFRKEEGGDFRDTRAEHDIKIIRVEDNGDVDFVLYGYMNRGIREGCCGVCVYHYSNDQNTVEELAFIPTGESCEFLEADLGTLSYVSRDNRLFLLFANRLYQVDIESGAYQVLEENIRKEEFAVSDTNAHAAWKVREGEDAGKVRFIQFDTLKTRVMEGTQGQSIVPLGFMNEDLVYGVVMEGGEVTDENGHVTQGIHTLRIEGFDGELKKEYHQDKLYITEVTIGDTLMEFQLCARSKKGYKPRKKDNIMNNKKAAESSVSVQMVSNGRTGMQVRLSFDDSPRTEEPLVVYSKIRNSDEEGIRLDIQRPEEEVYYVYGKGGLDSTHADPARAIQRAEEQMGVVLNWNQQYVWERGNKKTKQLLNLEDVPSAFRSGVLDRQAMEEALEGEGSLLDLSGCSLDSVLYEVSAQRPVAAKTGDGTSVVILGYDEYNTYLYDPTTGETYPYGMNDSTALFEKAGNIFISYMEGVHY